MADNAAELLAGEAIVENFWRRSGYDPEHCRSGDVWHLLCKAGYVTRDLKEREEPSSGWGERVHLVIPNREIRELFREEFRVWFGKIVGREQEEAFFAAFWQADGEGLKRVLEALFEKSRESSSEPDAAGKGSLSTLSRALVLGFFFLAFPEILSCRGMGRDVFRILDDGGSGARGAIVKISRASGMEKLAALAEEGFTQLREGECEAGYFAEQKVGTVVYASIAYREQRCEVRAALVKRP